MSSNLRQIILDTETTGLDPQQGHRIIEIGAVELVNRRQTGHHFHTYLNPERAIEADAVAIHGITNEQVADQPRFAEIAAELLDYIDGAELIIHNAPFDVGFLNAELQRWQPNTPLLEERCTITDSLAMARKRHPGQKNDLDTLCRRYTVNNSHRELHGALLDARILADLYLVMTGGQSALALSGSATGNEEPTPIRPVERGAERLVVVPSSEQEQQRHTAYLNQMAQAGVGIIWHQLAATE